MKEWEDGIFSSKDSSSPSTCQLLASSWDFMQSFGDEGTVAEMGLEVINHNQPT